MEDFKRSILRRETRGVLKGNFLLLFAANLFVEILLALSIFVSDYILAVIGIFILTSVLEFGLASLYLNFGENGVIDYKRIFISYKGKLRRFFKHLMTFIIKYVIILLSATLLLIPGLIKRYSYSQVKYLRASEPDYSVLRCLYISKKMMKWHRFELFILDLSFIPWFIISPLTGGLLLVYLIPYYSLTMAKYHLYIRSRYELKKEINKDFLDYFLYYINHLR